MSINRYKRRTIVGGIVIFVALALCNLIGGPAQSWGIPLLCALALIVLFVQMRLLGKTSRIPNADKSVHPTGAYPVVGRDLDKNAIDTGIVPGLEVLGAQYRKSIRETTEQAVDAILDDYIKLMRGRIDAHTIAVFFPTTANGYRIRRYWSSSTSINSEAVIYPGVGVIGSFLKDGLKHLNLQEIITDSITLYYYTRDAGIRSLMASPILTEGIERGYIIADSTEKKHFSDEDHAYLSTVASVLGQTVFYTYLYSEHKLKADRLAAMSDTENDFFKHLTLDSIFDKLVEIIPFAINCDRLTISLKNGDDASATIRRAWGEGAPGLTNKIFDLGAKTLGAVVYNKDICLFRNFAEDRYETRYFAGEPQCSLASFLAVPFGVVECKGLLFLESHHPDAFTVAHRDLLVRLATSAGLAIQKLHLYDRANTLATRDGLTGLVNHRQFQSLLRDEITRALRYQEPLSLVLCDIDFFKKINDTHGHPFGDMVLKGVAAKLQESIRDTIDVAARYGGEEFALVLVKTDTAHALETAERIRQAIEAIRFQGGRTGAVGVTMSFGVAEFGVHAKDGDSLIKKADKALYEAKHGGRNRVEVSYMASVTSDKVKHG